MAMQLFILIFLSNRVEMTFFLLFFIFCMLFDANRIDIKNIGCSLIEILSCIHDLSDVWAYSSLFAFVCTVLYRI